MAVFITILICVGIVLVLWKFGIECLDTAGAILGGILGIGLLAFGAVAFFLMVQSIIQGVLNYFSK